MSRSAIWNDANCLAARTAKPTFFNIFVGTAGDASSVHFAQQVFRGQPPQADSTDPAIRLDLSLLPHEAAGNGANQPGISDGANVIPRLLPTDLLFGFFDQATLNDERFTSGLISSTAHVLAGRTLELFDVHTVTSTFTSTPPIQRLPLVVSEGRHKPSHRMRGACFFNGFFSLLHYNNASAAFNFAPFVDALGPFVALKTTHIPLAVMCVPKIGGVASLSGVYIGVRPIINSAQYRRDGGAAIDYSAPRWPTFHMNLVEIGTFSGTTFTPRAQLVAAVAEGLDFDAALARPVLGAASGTKLCCVIRGEYAQAIEFPFVPASPDHCLCGHLSPDAPAAILNVLPNNDYRMAAFAVTGKRGFNAGECPAFAQVELDHGALARVPFYAGAPRSQHWSPVSQVFSFAQQNTAPQWSTWAHSQFPYTLHKTGALTVDGSVKPAEQLTGQRPLNTPLFELLEYADGPFQVVEPYPARTVTAKAARVQATAAGSHFEDVGMTIGKPRPDGKMVFGGKVINSVALSFVPYARQYLGGSLPVFAGINSATLPTPVPMGVDHGFSGETASSQFLPGAFVWWRHRQTVDLPPNSYTFPGLSAQIQRGEYCELLSPPVDAKRTESPTPFTEVSQSKEIDAHLFGACFVGASFGRIYDTRSPLFSVGGSFDQWRFGRTGGPPWRDARFVVSGYFSEGIMPAPLTGEYVLSRFDVGGVQTAGNLFRYSGVGKWGFDRTISYNCYSKVTSIDDFWTATNIFDASGRRFHQPQQSRTARFATIPVTETWNMRADCVELYCSLGATLQQFGAFQPDPPTEYGNPATMANWIRETFLQHDQPRGKIAETVVYVDGKEPSPVLTMTLRYRSAMRASVACSVDTSDLPQYPHTMSNSSSGIIANTVAGIQGSGNVSGEHQTLESHHGFESLTFTFNKEQTAQLINGDEILVTTWQGETTPPRPVFADTGGIFLHAFRMSLDVSPA